MAKAKIGKLPPRYSFILNPYADERLSKCPTCSKPTHLRKFALLIHIDEWGPMILGKTCRYCTPCELIIAHQDELEAQLAYSLHTIAPESVCTTFSVRCMHWRGRSPRIGSSFLALTKPVIWPTMLMSVALVPV
jgi:hypothetical protein